MQLCVKIHTCDESVNNSSVLRGRWIAGCKIAFMANGANQTDFMNSGSSKEPRSLLPWLVAGGVVVVILVALLFAGRHANPALSNPGGAGLAPADPYAKSLTLSNIKMSESSSLSGAKQTYIDGEIANHGDKTLTGVTVQVAFRDFTGQIAQKETMQLDLIRTHTPYVDTEPVSRAPVRPGETREFRLIFDHVTDSWNQQYPEVRVIAVESK